MTDLIVETRRRVGWSQGDLARRLGVTPAGVSHWERNERDGTIRLNTLTRALKAMRTRPAVRATPDVPPTPIWWDRSAFSGVPASGRGPERAAWRARNRIRTAAIAADARAERNQLPLADLWIAAEGRTVATDLMFDYWHVVDVATAYDAAMLSIADDRWRAVLAAPSGRTVSPPEDPAHPVAAAIAWSAAAIANSVAPRPARYAANIALVRAGFDWIALGLDDQAALDRAVAMIRHGGDATPYVQLMCARYDESD